MKPNLAESSPQFDDLARQKRPTLISEFALFLSETKKWWLIPFLLVLAAMGLLIFFAGTGAAPFIYTLF